MIKDELNEYLRNQTSFFNAENVSNIFTAASLSEKFGLKRNTVSHYLNQLYNEGQLVKVNTRPVYFFNRQVFEDQNYNLKKNEYCSLQEIIEEKPKFKKKHDFFSYVIGSSGSLHHTIEQLKMAAFYPNGGLPIFLSGESGTGKSFLIRLLHQYCISNGIFKEEAPFITINCAQYANNPELLTSNLFGHVQGAFTGAFENKIGAFEKARDGLLFLDEIHRLSPEGQEKLFTYLDQGIIYRVGDSAKKISINCRLAFATTESLDNTFLRTFLRRVPVQVRLPSLDERTLSEKKQLILQSFFQEQRAIGKRLIISPKVFSILTKLQYRGNVGELKNLIKVIIAKSYIHLNDDKDLNITIHDMPPEFLRFADELLEESAEYPIIIDGSKSIDLLIEEHEPELKWIIQCYEKILIEYIAQEKKLRSSVPIFTREIYQLFDHLLYETKKERHQEMLIFITQNVRQMIERIERSFQISFNGSMIYAISQYLFQRRSVAWLPDENEELMLIKELLEDVKESYEHCYQYVDYILKFTKTSLDIELTDMDRIILTIYVSQSGYTKDSNLPKAIIAAHGYATASSIANVANRLLDQLVFEAFDMPLDITAKKIAESINSYIEKNDVSNGLIILVDMGSLKEIYQFLLKNMAAPLLIMNNVTTGLAVVVGEAIQQQKKISEIPNIVTNTIQIDSQLILPEKNKVKILLITCSTGIGTSVQISNLLNKSIPSKVSLKILPCEYHQLENSEDFLCAYDSFNVIGIVGTDNPRVKSVPFLSLEELISGNGTEVIAEWLADELSDEDIYEFNQQMVRNFSLDRVIQSVTILDTEKVISKIEDFTKRLEENWFISITNNRKIALYVHVSCLIERLIRNAPIEDQSPLVKLTKCQKDTLREIKNAFSVIEKTYSVDVPDSELIYIYDILFEKTDETRGESDF